MADAISTPFFPLAKTDSTLAPAPPKPEIDPKVMKAASEFETMVLAQMLQPMFEALDSDGMFGGGSGERMFRPMLVDQYAQAMSKAGGVGIAQSVAEEMMRLQTAQALPPQTQPKVE
jgi:Rod binding domain-containing protein